MQKTLVIFVLFFLSTVSFAHAFTGMSADELRAEIARLTRVAEHIRAQLRLYGDDPSTVHPGEPINDGQVPSTTEGGPCLHTNLQMSRGDYGGSVSTLQQFLADQGVYSQALITGYFGPATERGVQAWQARYGIVNSGTPASTGYGRVGPSTLHAMHKGCPGGAYTGISGSLHHRAVAKKTKRKKKKGILVEHYTLSLNPTRGIMPLSVTADFTITGSTCTSYLLDWGDGALPISYNSQQSTGCKPLPIHITRTHIYNTAGEHTVVFKTGKAPLTKIQQVSTLPVQVLGLPQTSY